MDPKPRSSSFFNTLVGLVVIGLLLYFFHPQLQMEWDTVYNHYFPCSRPITYSIGTYDTRFGLSQANFLSDVSQAAAIWEKSVGKDFFMYEADGKGTLKINLIYDGRQAATVKLKSLGMAVTDDRASYDALRAKYTALQASYTVDKSAYDADVASFKTATDAYNTEVSEWNSRGGATPAEARKLSEEKKSLSARYATIQVEETHLNASVDEINSMVTVLNHMASVLNIDATKFNAVGQSQGEEFTEGLYVSDANGEHIDIYQYDNSKKLVRVLAHELGHALGLDHVDDPQAIMYRLNQSTNEQVTAADLAELKAVCKIK